MRVCILLKNLHYVILGRKSEPLTTKNNVCYIFSATRLSPRGKSDPWKWCLNLKKESLVGCGGRTLQLILDRKH